MEGPRTILHVDMDAFFAALEAKADPSLRGKPILVCGNLGGRGVVCTASYEARPSGVRSAMSVSEARRRCPHGVFIEGDHKKYLDASLRLQAVLLAHTPMVEPASIDEAYLDCSGDPRRYGTGLEIARRIREEIRETVGVPGSVGVGPNKMLAKLASEMAKPDGVREIAPDAVARVLRPLPVDALSGVGEKTARHLEELGVRTVGDLELVPLDLLERVFGIFGRTLYRQCRGEDDAPVTPYSDEPPPKTLGHEATFPVDVGGEGPVRAALASLADRVAARLRARALAATHATLKVRTSDFRTTSRGGPLPNPASDDLTLYDHARELFRRVPPARKGIRLLGLVAGGLVPQLSVWQTSLFDYAEERARGFSREERARELSRAIDHVRRKFGRAAIQRGRALPRAGE